MLIFKIVKKSKIVAIENISEIMNFELEFR
jgi:hypothetical protein